MTLTIFTVFLLITLATFTTARNYLKAYLIVSTFFLSFLAACYDPIKGWLVNGDYTDLYRIFMELDAFRKYGWSNVGRYISTNYNALPLAKVYMYLNSLSNWNHLISFLSTILCYGSVFAALFNIGTKLGSTRKQIAQCAAFFVLVNDYSRVISNIRMPLTCCLFILIWSLEFKSEKKTIRYYMGYVSLCLVHNAMFLFLLVKIAIDVLPEHFNKVVKAASLCSYPLLGIILLLLLKFRNNIFISGLIDKIELYSFDDINKNGIAALRLAGNELFVNIIRLLLIVILILYVKCHRKSKRFSNVQSIDQLINYLECLICMSIGALWSYHIFNRTILFILMFSPVLALFIVTNKKINLLEYSKIHIVTATTWGLIILHTFYYFNGHVYQQLCF